MPDGPLQWKVLATSEFEKSFVLPVSGLSERSNQMKTIVHNSSALRFVYANL